MMSKLRFAILALLLLTAAKTFGQAPNITYSSPQVYYEDFVIDTLKPANTGGAVPSTYPNTIETGFYGYGVAIDGSGNLFYPEDYTNDVKKVTPAGVVTTVVTGLNDPVGIAIDGSGNLFIVNSGTNSIVKVAAGSSSFTTYATGFNAPYGIAVDAFGNVYVCDTNNKQVKEIPAGGGTPVVIGSGFNRPTGVAVDATGNVYVADENNGTISKIAAGNGPVTILVTDSNGPTGVALDAAQNIYYTAVDNEYIVELPAVGSGPIQLGTYIDEAQMIVVDPQNNLFFIAQSGSGGDSLWELPFGGYKISQALPAGLYFDVNTGYIYGKPTVTSAATNYIVTASNVGGTSNATLNIAVKIPAKPVISYATPQVYQANIAISPLVPTNTGDMGSWESTPAMPPGLYIDYTTGIITGTPTQVKAATNYTILAANAGGHTTFVLSITVNPTPKAVISYKTPDVFTAGQTISPLSPTNTGGPLPAKAGTYAISPALSAGLVFNTTTGVISGTPSAGMAATNYTVTATNTGGAATTVVDITVNLPPPPAFSYSTPKVFAVNQAISPVTPASTGGTIPTTGAFNISPALPAGLDFNIVTGAISGTPTATSPATNYTVTASNDGGTGTAVINITVNVPSNNATLSGLSLSSGTLTPAFSATTTSYTTSISGSVPSITLTPTATVAGSAITVNGSAVASGSASQAITLTEGNNTITTVVTAQDGVTTKTYTLTVTKAASTISSLSNITLSKGTLSPAFASGTTSYTNLVTNGTTSVTLTPTVTDPTATIKVNGVAVASGHASGPVILAVGSNPVAVVVTAQDGATASTYNVNVIRPSTNAKLSNLTISGGALKPLFNTDSVKYSDYVPYAVSSITVTPTATVSGSTITVNGVVVASGTASAPISLIVGFTTLSIVVTAQDGVTTETYTVNIERPAGSTNANLATLAVSKGTLSPAFAVGTVVYTDMVTNGTSSLTVTPTLSNANATMTVNGTAVASGHASGPVTLVVGSNVITILVTAQNGTSTKTYKVTVIRPSTNAKLAGLTISSGALTPAFNTNTTSYTASVTNATASITLPPTVAVTGATIKVNGTAVTSGSPSGAIALSVGANTISTVITAQDGVTTDTYTITVTRAAAGTNIPADMATVGVQNFEPLLANDGITVHQGISPNGDGINDYLQIDNITNYPNNDLKIMTRNGQLIFEAKGYDNATKVFDGHSNKTGQMQLPGTYFYELDYVVKGVTRQKTGYLVLKY